MRIAIMSLLMMLAVCVGCRDVDGTVRIGSDPPERSENWDGDLDRIRWENERARRLPEAGEPPEPPESPEPPK